MGGRLPLSSRNEDFGEWSGRGRVSDIMALAEMGNELFVKLQFSPAASYLVHFY